MKMKMLALFIISLFLVPQTVMAEDIHQKLEIEIKPRSIDSHTKLFNMVDANNSWLDNKHIWESLNISDGRIIGEGVIPNPIKIDDFENESGTAKLSIISVCYLDSYDIMSGTSESYIRLPLAVNRSSYSESIEMCIKLYAIEGDAYNITSFNYTDVEYSTYASSYLLYNYTGPLQVAKNKECDILVQNYTYPANITNLSLSLFYLHLRAPVVAKSTYILLQYIEIPDAKKDPIYLLASYKNETGYYYSSGKVKSFSNAPSWSMLCLYGISEDIYSFNIPDNEIYEHTQPLSMTLHHGEVCHVSFAMPVYSNSSAVLTLTFEIEGNFTTHVYTEHRTLNSGINNIFVYFNFTSANPGSSDEKLLNFTLKLNSTSGDNIFVYGVRSPNSKIMQGDMIYFWATAPLFYKLLSTTQYVTFESFHFQGIQEPVIKYKKTYVYSILDFPILIYKAGTVVLSNAVYFLTFGQVDLRYLYNNAFILAVAQAAKLALDRAANGHIGLFIKMTINFVVNAAQWWGHWLLQSFLFLLDVAAIVMFLWPWVVLNKGFIVLQENGVDAMFDYYSSYADRITSLMNRFIRRG